MTERVNTSDWREYARQTTAPAFRDTKIPQTCPQCREINGHAVGCAKVPYRDIPQAMATAPARPRHVAGEMNRLEGRYASHLEVRKLTGEIVEWRFEPLNLCLAKATFLKIDFAVVLPGDVVEMHEVKGHWEDDARAKIKFAAQVFPWWRFYGVTWDKKIKDWKFERIGRRGENNGR